MHVHVPAATAVLLLVYTAALAIAATHLGTAALAGGAVLAGLLLRAALRSRLHVAPSVRPGPVLPAPALPDPTAAA